MTNEQQRMLGRIYDDVQRMRGEIAERLMRLHGLVQPPPPDTDLAEVAAVLRSELVGLRAAAVDLQARIDETAARLYRLKNETG